MSDRVTERWSDRRMFRRSDGTRGATRGFDVTGPSDEDAARIASDSVTGLAVPSEGDLHPLGGSMRVANVDIKRKSAGAHHRITCEYDRETSSSGGGTSESDPLDEPPTWDWRFGSETVTVDRDAHGNPIIMSNRQPVEGGVDEEAPTFGLVLTRNEPMFDPFVAKEFHLAVNTDRLRIEGINVASAGAAQCRGIRPTGPVDLTEDFVPVAYEFVFRDLDGPSGTSPFFHRLQDRGSTVLVSDHPKDESSSEIPVQLLDGDANPPDAPVLLDGNGKPINSKWQAGLSDYTIASLPQPAGSFLEDAGDATFLWYQPQFIKLRRFSGLGLS